MSLLVNTPLANIVKDGTKHLSGVEEAVLKNIEACKELSNIVRTSLGPRGALCTAHLFRGARRETPRRGPRRLTAGVDT